MNWSHMLVFSKRLAGSISIPLLLWLPLQTQAASVSSDLGTGLVSYWELNEVSGVRNAATSTNNLSDVNSTGSTVSCTYGGAADLERSSSNYLQKSSPVGLDISEIPTLSMSFWWQPESYTGLEPLLSKENFPADRGWIVYYDSDMHFRWSDSQYDHAWSVSLTNGTCYHIVIKHKNSTHTSELFINNVSQGTRTGGSADSSGSSGPFTIGAIAPASIYADGAIDEVGIWNYELSTTSIALLYNSGLGIPYADVVDSENLLLGLGGNVSGMPGTTTCEMTSATSSRCVSSQSEPTEYYGIDFGTAVLVGGLLMFFIAYWFVGLMRRK